MLIHKAAIGELTVRLAEHAKTLRLPAFAIPSEAATATQDKMIAIIGERCVALSGE
ncbi:hypothetical protein [Methylocella tundrae]|uniref:Uncharacterized protein n=1 Tax=Methylocella tundrae TaxID=227605 RepID=A0A4U8Z7A8_METTU|nr:hypothetical protein [Methylocella tundrae]WPP02708.1 hypothetical protein SIN04_00925 [Methylocella tundrae]VFU17390.1 protein of unknown function [Methylocella tundrae]